MRPADTDYAHYRISRAAESLESARLLFEQGHLIDTVNRLYYACFYAASALLYVEGYSSAKHSGVISLFDLHWIKPKRLDPALGQFYRMMFENRQKGDYRDFVVSEQSEVEQWFEQTRDFVKQLSAKAEQIISESQQGETQC